MVCLSKLVEKDDKNRENSQLKIHDSAFDARFDGSQWIVEWHWKTNQPIKLNNTISCYDMGLEGEKKCEFEKEVERWINEGILIPWKKKVCSGILPLMAVEQPTKK